MQQQQAMGRGGGPGGPFGGPGGPMMGSGPNSGPGNRSGPAMGRGMAVMGGPGGMPGPGQGMPPGSGANAAAVQGLAGIQGLKLAQVQAILAQAQQAQQQAQPQQLAAVQMASQQPGSQMGQMMLNQLQAMSAGLAPASAPVALATAGPSGGVQGLSPALLSSLVNMQLQQQQQQAGMRPQLQQVRRVGDGLDAVVGSGVRGLVVLASQSFATWMGVMDWNAVEGVHMARLLQDTQTGTRCLKSVCPCVCLSDCLSTSVCPHITLLETQKLTLHAALPACLSRVRVLCAVCFSRWARSLAAMAWCS
jgi:hypothetical protein